MNEDFLVSIFLFGGTAVVLWNFFNGRHKERMAMIEKGVNPADFKSASPTINPLRLFQGSVLRNLKWGLLFLFAGIGLLVGIQLDYYLGFHEGAAVFGSMLIAGGIALIIFYIIAAKKIKKEQEDK
jgi:hypothetical protein